MFNTCKAVNLAKRTEFLDQLSIVDLQLILQMYTENDLLLLPNIDVSIELITVTTALSNISDRMTSSQVVMLNMLTQESSMPDKSSRANHGSYPILDKKDLTVLISQFLSNPNTYDLLGNKVHNNRDLSSLVYALIHVDGLLSLGEIQGITAIITTDLYDQVIFNQNITLMMPRQL